MAKMDKDNLGNNVLVIIVTFNAMRWAEKCLKSIASSTCNCDIFVIDNGSTDGTQQFIKNSFPRAIIVQSKRNIGFGAANNIGIKYAIEHNYGYIYLINQDAWVDPETIQSLIEISKQHSEYGILSPLQMTGDGKNFDKNFYENLRPKLCPGFLSDYEIKNHKDVYPIHFIMAAHWLLPCHIIKKVGMFSPAFFHYGEDGNLIDRCHYWRIKIGICPALKGYHDREYRKITPEKKLYNAYASIVQRINNPLRTCALKTVYSFFKNIIMLRGIPLNLKITYTRKLLTDYRYSKSILEIYKDEKCYVLLQDIDTPSYNSSLKQFLH